MENKNNLEEKNLENNLNEQNQKVSEVVDKSEQLGDLPKNSEEQFPRDVENVKKEECVSKEKQQDVEMDLENDKSNLNNENAKQNEGAINISEIEFSNKKENQKSKLKSFFKGKSKKKTIAIICVVVVLIMFLSSLTSNSNLQAEYDKLSSDYDALRIEYNEYKEEMLPYEQYSLEDLKEAKAQREKKEKEAEEKKKEKERQGYNTGITYSQLERNPDKYMGEKVKFSGEVIQVIESSSSDTVEIRLMLNDDYDKVLYCSYSKDLVSSRILEDDKITIYGVSVGTITYESTGSGPITIPAVTVDQIKR